MEASGRAHLHWVRLGPAQDDQREALSGLEAGQVVISPPPAGLRDGMPVEVK